MTLFLRTLLLFFVFPNLVTTKMIPEQKIQLVFSPQEPLVPLPVVQDCFISSLLIHGGPQLNYSTSVTPITVNADPSSINRTVFSQSLTQLGKPVDRTENIRHMRCYVAIFSAPTEIYTFVGPGRASKAEKRLGILYPDVWLLLIDLNPHTNSFYGEVLHGDALTLIRDKAIQVPELFLLAQGGDNGPKSCWKLWPYSGSGGVLLPLPKIDCDLNSLVKLQRKSVGGYDMKWRYSNTPGDKYGRSSYSPPFCPFTLESNVKCSLSEGERTFKVIIDSFNMSFLENQMFRLYPTPVFSFGRIWRRRHPFDLEVTGYTADFCFITSDNVIAVQDRGLNSITGAFQMELWIILVPTTFSIALALSMLHGKTFYRYLITNMYAVVGALLEQYVSPGKVGCKIRNKTLKIIMLTWMIGSIVLSNCFRGKAKSSAILQKKYGTNWTNLLQLSDFGLTFGYDPQPGRKCSLTDKWLNDYKTLNKARNLTVSFPRLRSLLKYTGDLDLERRATFALVDELINLEAAIDSTTTNKTRTWLQERATKLRPLVQRADLICGTSIDTVIGKDLTKPRTAFVTTKESFEKDWSAFQSFMAKPKNKYKFVHSCAAEDATLRAFQGYYITGRLTGVNGDLVLKRMRGLMSSGIYGLWKKWDKLRLMFKASSISTKQNAVPLSLADSDIQQMLDLLLFGVFIALIVFLIEIPLSSLVNYRQ